MPQRSVRFPDDLHAAIEAEVAKRGHPHTFSSVLLEWAERGSDPAPAASSARTVRARTLSEHKPSLGRMCRTCVQNGPPKTRPCAKCGHQR